MIEVKVTLHLSPELVALVRSVIAEVDGEAEAESGAPPVRAVRPIDDRDYVSSLAARVATKINQTGSATRQVIGLMLSEHERRRLDDVIAEAVRSGWITKYGESYYPREREQSDETTI